jgi:carbon storage regulator
MLVFKRKTGQAFLIGNDIEIEVLAVDNGQVKLGIRAPREVTVLRKEIAVSRDANLASAKSVEDTPLENAIARLRNRWPIV